jgi:hypothetical protein
MPAFGATHKLRRRLIAASGLNLPNKNFHVSAFITLHPDSGQGFDFLFFFADHRHKRLSFWLNDFAGNCLRSLINCLFGEPAFSTGQSYVFAVAC